MNYTQMFANGGKTNDQELIRGIQKILGVDDAQMEQLLQIGINKYGSLEGIGQALNEATQGLTQNSTPEEVQAAVASVFATNADSQMFKCGGKLQQLVSRFGRGGIAECGCGCGGVKLKQEGGIAPKVLQGSTPTRSAALAGLRTVRVPDTNVAKRRRVGAVRDNKGGLHLYESADVNGNSAQTAITIHPGDTVINQSVLRRSGWDPRIIKWGDDNYEPIMQRMRPFVNGVPYKQDGGIVLEDLPGHDVDVTLTRRQARQLAAQNKGFNNEQFSFALANAKNALRNQGLRGRELRERAREMAAGITPVQRSIVDTPIVDALNVETPQGFGTVTSIKEGILNKPQTSSLDNLSFADAFAQSRKSGAKTFDWRGRSYGTKLAEPKNNEPTMLVEAKIYAPSTQLPEAKIYAPTMLPETRVYPPTMLNEARVYAPTQLPEARVYAPTILGEAVITPKTNIASIYPSITNTSTMTGGVGINRDNLALDEANRRAEERRRTYEQQRANSISPSLVNTSTFKCGGKAKEGIKLVPREKCGGKTKKHQIGGPVAYGLLNSPKQGTEYEKPWSLWQQNRGGGGNVSDYGEIVTDENGLQYRDIRDTDWNSMRGNLNQSFHREYIQTPKFRKAVKKGFKPIYDQYSNEQLDSLKHTFNNNFGNWGSSINGEWQDDGDPNIVENYQSRYIMK